MAISVRATSANNGNPVNNLDITMPTGTTTGDLVIVISFRNAATDGSEYIVDNNGSTSFTEARRDTDNANGASLGIFYRRILGGDPSTFNFKHNAPAQGDTTLSLIAVSFQNPDPTNVFNITPDGTTKTFTSPDSGTADSVSITTTVNGCIHFIASLREGSNFTNTPSGYTATNSSGGTYGIRSFYKIITTAGSTGAQTLTAGDSTSSIIQSFAIANVAGTQYNSSPSGVITHAGSLSAFIKLPKYTVKIG